MRLLQASEYDIKKTYTSIKENIEWLNSVPKVINDTIIYLLNSGFLYIHGRDCHFRPIIVVSIKMLKVILSQNYTFDDINKCTTYLINYLIKYLLIPGQIENWIVFVDFENVGISDIGDFKKILSTLSKYRGRVYKNYFFFLSGILKISVKAAVKMFSSVAKKLVILGSDELEKSKFDFKGCEFITTESNIFIEGEKTAVFSEDNKNVLAKFKDVLGEHYAVVNNFDHYPLPVLARNYLEDGKSKNLWYEEVVPHGSVFYTIIITPDETNALNMEEIKQIGGHASIGCGFTRFIKLN